MPALIIPSKSHQIEKFTAGGNSKGIKDRFRIIIPIKKSIRNDTTKEEYRELQTLIAKSIGIKQYVGSQYIKGFFRLPSLNLA